MQVEVTTVEFIASERTFVGTAIGSAWTILAGLAFIGAVNARAELIAPVICGALTLVGLAIVIFDKNQFRLVVDRSTGEIATYRRSVFGLCARDCVEVSRVVNVRLGDDDNPYDGSASYSVDLTLDDGKKFAASYLSTNRLTDEQRAYAQELASYLGVPVQIKA